MFLESIGVYNKFFFMNCKYYFSSVVKCFVVEYGIPYYYFEMAIKNKNSISQK